MDLDAVEAQQRSPLGVRRVITAAFVIVLGVCLGAVIGLVVALYSGLIPFQC